MLSFNPNVWYSLVYTPSNGVYALGRSNDLVNYALAIQLYSINSSDVHQQWQILTSPNSSKEEYYMIRASMLPSMYYIAAYCEDWTNCTSNTLSGLRVSNSPDTATTSLKWKIHGATLDATDIKNLGNATSWSLGASEVYIHMVNNSESWLISSISEINDTRYSSIITAMPPASSGDSPLSFEATTTSNSLPPSATITDPAATRTTASYSSGSSLSSGGKIGITAASIVGPVLIVTSLAFWYFRRKRSKQRRRQQQPDNTSLAAKHSSKEIAVRQSPVSQNSDRLFNEPSLPSHGIVRWGGSVENQQQREEARGSANSPMEEGGRLAEIPHGSAADGGIFELSSQLREYGRFEMRGQALNELSGQFQRLGECPTSI